jgi:hypothetical protein
MMILRERGETLSESVASLILAAMAAVGIAWTALTAWRRFDYPDAVGKDEVLGDDEFVGRFAGPARDAARRVARVLASHGVAADRDGAAYVTPQKMLGMCAAERLRRGRKRVWRTAMPVRRFVVSGFDPAAVAVPSGYRGGRFFEAYQAAVRTRTRTVADKRDAPKSALDPGLPRLVATTVQTAAKDPEEGMRAMGVDFLMSEVIPEVGREFGSHAVGRDAFFRAVAAGGGISINFDVVVSEGQAIEVVVSLDCGAFTVV